MNFEEFIERDKTYNCISFLAVSSSQAHHILSATRDKYRGYELSDVSH